MAEEKGTPVWSKRVGDQAVADVNIQFCAGYDVKGREAADKRLAPFDLETNAAHLVMLVEEGLLTTEDGEALAGALIDLRKRVASGEDILLPTAEDIHMSVETHVTARIGEGAGGRLHTARSRNDQVATDMKLWLRRETAAIAESLYKLAQSLADHAEQHVETVCAGFTHGQPAMVTSWGHWTMSYIPRILRDLRQVMGLLQDLKTCPLGAAASYGTSWPINRERTAQLLGFKYPTPSGTDAIWSRGELEGRMAEALARFLTHLAGIAQDLILLTTPPRKWLRLADEHVTGSSIMPQKRNPDFAEVTRSRASYALGISQSLNGISSVLPTGYNRDSQWTKYLAMDAVDNARGSAELFSDVFKNLTVNKQEMEADCRIGFLNATDVADFLSSKRNLPFRTCYRLLGEITKACEDAGEIQLHTVNTVLDREGIDQISDGEWEKLENPRLLLELRDQTGNPAPKRVKESLKLLRRELEESISDLHKTVQDWDEASEKLWKLLEVMAAR